VLPPLSFSVLSSGAVRQFLGQELLHAVFEATQALDVVRRLTRWQLAIAVDAAVASVVPNDG